MIFWVRLYACHSIYLNIYLFVDIIKYKYIGHKVVVVDGSANEPNVMIGHLSRSCREGKSLLNNCSGDTAYFRNCSDGMF